MFSRPKILFLVSLLFVALLNPKFNPYLLFKFLIFYHSSIYKGPTISRNGMEQIETPFHGMKWNGTNIKQMAIRECM